MSVDGIACPATTLSLVPFSLPPCETLLLEATITLGPLSITQLQAHFMLFSLFASTIGPFGGFFASGLKRSIKIKVPLSLCRTSPTPSPATAALATAWTAS